MSFIAECDMLAAKMAKVWPDSKTAMQLIVRFNHLTQHIFFRFLETPNQLPLLRSFFTADETFKEATIVFGSEIFIILHEIAHIELGHDKFPKGSPQFISAQLYQRELDADLGAIQKVGNKDGLVLGIIVFMWWHSLYQGLENKYSDTHPSASIRFKNILESVGSEFSLGSRQQIERAMERITSVEDSLKQGNSKKWWLGEIPSAEYCRDEMMDILNALLPNN